MGDRRPAFVTSCTEFVFPGYWHFDNGATIKINDVLLEYGGLPHVLPLAVYQGTILQHSYPLSFGLGWA